MSAIAPVHDVREAVLEDTIVVADDGRPLHGRWYRPASDPVRGFVLIAPAMATPTRYYEPFARWLATNGFATLGFNYRGMESREAIKAERGDLLRWAADAASALETLEEERRLVAPGTPITWVGHSFGGQILPFVRHDLIDSALLVATGQGYFHHNTPWLRRMAPLLWRGIVPLSTLVAGYFPGRTLGYLGDLPTAVVRQWARWCLHPEYWGADVADIRERQALITHQVTTLSFSDDEYVTAAGIDALIEQMTSALVERLWITPESLDSERIGHHGFFRQSNREHWHQLVLPRLAAATQPDPRSPNQGPTYVRNSCHSP